MPRDFDPTTEYRAPNGDIRQKRNPRNFGGSPDYEDKGFMSRRGTRQGITVTEGTRQPERVRPAHDPWVEAQKKESQSAPSLTPSQIRMTYKRP